MSPIATWRRRSIWRSSCSARCCSKAKPASARPRSRACSRRPGRAAHSPAVLRGARHHPRRLRVELRAAAARDPAARGLGAMDRDGTARDLFSDSVPHQAADPAGAVVDRWPRAGPPHRRARSRRRRVRGIPAGDAGRLSGDHPRARDDQGGRGPRRDHHVEPDARAARCTQAALPLLLDRLSRTTTRNCASSCARCREPQRGWRRR